MVALGPRCQGPRHHLLASSPSVRTALVSDIHANLAAFEAVLADIATRRVDRIVCLGDIVGYGPDPVECADLVAKRCEWSLMGNHDCAVLYEPTNFNEAARRAAFWTRDQINNHHVRLIGELESLKSAGEIGPDTFERRREEIEADRRRRLEFIMTLSVRKAFGPFIAVHGTPRKCINEYLFPDDTLSSPHKVGQIFAHVPRYCLVGHTHVPGVFTDEPDFYPPEDFDQVYVLRPEEKAIINPGSVGQPRDGDPRASYAVLEVLAADGSAPPEGATAGATDAALMHRIEFHRVEYDVRRTVERIHAIPELSNWLGDRLLEGR